jgi:hypothetical protein
MRTYAACHLELGPHGHEAEYRCKCGAHSIKFVWAGGRGDVHIDDHDPARHGVKRGHVILRGCDNGCGVYKLVAGDDPRAAEAEEF